MRFKLSILFISMCLAGTIMGLPTQDDLASIDAEFGRVLQNKQAFPQGSQQNKALSKLRKKIPQLFESRDMSSVEPEDSKTDIVPQKSQQAPITVKRGNYGAIMKHHKTVAEEGTQVKALHQMVNAKFEDLKKQIDIIKKYHAGIQNGVEVGDDYQVAMDKYEQDEQEYKEMQSKYLSALNQYNEHRNAYLATLGTK